MTKKMFLNNLNVSYSFYISIKIKNNFDNMIAQVLYKKTNRIISTIIEIWY